MLQRTLLILILTLAFVNTNQIYDEDDDRPAHHTPVFSDDSINESSKKLKEKNFDSHRLLQSDNPFSPTGEFMSTTPGTKPTDEVLTVDLVGQIASQAGLNLRPNVTTNTNPAPSQFMYSGLNSPLAVTINGVATNASNPVSTLGNNPWNSINVDDYSTDPSWISATSFLTRLNLSYFYPNQILILTVQNSSLGTAFNVTYRSLRGFVNAIVLVNQSYVSSLITNSILSNLQSVDVDASSSLYNVTKSLLQSLFYDFTLAPLTLLNGTQTQLQGATLYDLRYRSKNGMYNFVIKSQISANGSITGTVLACNPITVSVSTQTVPVLASINIINVDANFKFVNQTIYNFISKNLNTTNSRVTYNSVVVWSNRAGTAILYFLNLTFIRAASSQTILTAINYNLTHRHQTISYWRQSSIGISPLNHNSAQYQQIGYLQVLTNPVFVNVDISARTNYPTVIVGPIIKVETQKIGNETGYKLTYFGVNGQNVQAAYRPS